MFKSRIKSLVATAGLLGAVVAVPVATAAPAQAAPSAQAAFNCSVSMTSLTGETWTSPGNIWNVGNLICVPNAAWLSGPVTLIPYGWPCDFTTQLGEFRVSATCNR